MNTEVLPPVYGDQGKRNGTDLSKAVLEVLS